LNGDSERLAQVVTNLLSNAIAYNREEGQVRVMVQTTGSFVELSVWNTGHGIAAEDLPHVFDRFRRADKSRSQGGAHSGLGLAIAKAIVQAHGGGINASSEPGESALFVVRLPV
jgi:two-component system sensor histidine kinase BaeS